MWGCNKGQISELTLFFVKVLLHSRLKNFRRFSISIHNKKNGHTTLKPNKINGFSVFKKLHILIFWLFHTFLYTIQRKTFFCENMSFNPVKSRVLGSHAFH